MDFSDVDERLAVVAVGLICSTETKIKVFERSLVALIERLQIW